MDDDRPGGAHSRYLVERYWPGITEPVFRSAHVRLREATAAMRREGVAVVHLRSALAAGEDAIFSFFEATSLDDVAEANRRGAVPFDRIVPVIEVE
jgi:hypothetical protein